MRHVAIAAILALTPSMPRLSGACSPVPESSPHVLDAAYAADTTAPGAVTASAVVEPPRSSDGGGCGATPLCGDGGPFLVVYAEATDDLTPVGRLGYRLEVVGGQAPAGFTLPTEALAPDGSELRIRIATTAAPFSVEVAIRAVDLNGNEGPASVITIAQEE